MSEFKEQMAALREYAIAHPLDVFQMEGPHREHYLEFKCRGHKYRICFTYQVSNEIKGFVLSVYDAEKPKQKPDEKVCRYIADEIFPDSVYMDGDALNINILHISRKYIAFEGLNEKIANL